MLKLLKKLVIGKPIFNEFNWYDCAIKSFKRTFPAIVATSIALETNGVPQIVNYKKVPIPISLIAGVCIQIILMIKNYLRKVW